jgi:hypothetical protein
MTIITVPILQWMVMENPEDAICRKFKRDNNLEYKPANIVVSTEQNNLYTTLLK